MKKVLIILIVAFITIACNGQTPKKSTLIPPLPQKPLQKKKLLKPLKNKNTALRSKGIKYIITIN